MNPSPLVLSRAMKDAIGRLGVFQLPPHVVDDHWNGTPVCQLTADEQHEMQKDQRRLPHVDS